MSFFPTVDIMFRCRDMFGQSSKSVPKSGFCPQPVGVDVPGSSDQIFQIAVISEYVSKFGMVVIHSVTSEICIKKERTRCMEKPSVSPPGILLF